METIKVTTRLSNEERETVLVYDNVDKVWHMDTTIPKHVNKAKKQSWAQTVEYVYEDGVVCGGAFTAPARAITIRNAEKKQMSEKQLGNLLGDDEDDENDERHLDMNALRGRMTKTISSAEALKDVEPLIMDSTQIIVYASQYED